MNKPIIYLSGGMRTNWQERVKSELGFDRFGYIDPKNNNTKDPKVYTPWDLFGVERSDIVFCYLESENPSGAGLLVEAGYGLGLGKHVIAVIEPRSDIRYFQLLLNAVDVEFPFLNDAIEYLRSLGA